MALETGTYISDLVSTNPASSDNISQGDDHIRLLKSTVKATFPNITGAVTPTQADLNKLTSSGSPQFSTIELGAASDTTISRVSAGLIAVEGGNVPLENRANTFTANQIISVTDNTNAALRITQLGTGDAIRVEDSTNPDSTPFIVDASGNVGIGTASPTVDGKGLQIKNTGGAASLRVSDNSGGTGFDILQASGAGYVWNRDNNVILFGTNNTERMRIDSNGKVLVGTSSTFIGSSSLQIASSLSEQIAIRSTAAAAGRCWRFTADYNNTTYIINQDSVGVYIGNGGTSWSGLSDERAKDIIEPISDAASKVSTLRAVIGKYKTDEEGKRRSFLIAQDVQAVLPEAVSVADQETGYLGLSYTDTIPLLTAALQEALTEVSSLKARVAALEAA